METLERIIELTIDSETVYYKGIEPGTGMATYTSTLGDWYVFATETEAEDFITEQKKVDTVFTGGNPSSTPPKPF